ncbi:MAG: hypothetical protein Q7S22_05690 [Candidatus Micrarchaeota archaeon]|nr:hypothetical protein [Candidatus Micrarchaeota archaeon]
MVNHPDSEHGTSPILGGVIALFVILISVAVGINKIEIEFPSIIHPRKTEIFKTLEKIERTTMKCLELSENSEEICGCRKTGLLAKQELRAISETFLDEPDKDILVILSQTVDQRIIRLMSPAFSRLHPECSNQDLMGLYGWMERRKGCYCSVNLNVQAKEINEFYKEAVKTLSGKKERIETIVERHFPKVAARVR